MLTLLTDLRLALRALRCAPGFTTTAVLTLGSGMALCTAAIVVVNAYLLHDLPYPASERLHTIRYGGPGQSSPREMERLDWTSVADVIELLLSKMGKTKNNAEFLGSMGNGGR